MPFRIAGLLMDLYQQGLLGGQPKRLRGMQEEAMKMALESSKKAATLGASPVWETGTPPAPGEGIAAGGIIPKDYKAGSSYDEAAAYADLMEKSGLRAMMADKPNEMVFRAAMSKILSPEQIEKTTGAPGGLYPSDPYRKIQEIEGLRTRGQVGDEISGYQTPKLESWQEALYGIQPKTTTLAPGHGLVRDGEVIREPAPVQEKLPTADVQEYNLWAQRPPAQFREQVAKTGEPPSYGDFIVWKATVVNKAKADAIVGKMDPEKKMALEFAKVALRDWAENMWMTNMEVTPDQMMSQLAILYNKGLELTRTGQLSPDDPLSIRPFLPKPRE